MYKLGVKIRESTFQNPVISGSITVKNSEINNNEDFVDFSDNGGNDNNEQCIGFGADSLITLNLSQTRTEMQEDDIRASRSLDHGNAYSHNYPSFERVCANIRNTKQSNRLHKLLNDYATDLIVENCNHTQDEEGMSLFGESTTTEKNEIRKRFRFERRNKLKK